MSKSPMIWTHSTIYVDIDTGEQITKHNAKKNYIKVKTEKHATLTGERPSTRGHIEWTIQCTKRGKQLELFTNINKRKP